MKLGERKYICQDRESNRDKRKTQNSLWKNRAKER